MRGLSSARSAFSARSASRMQTPDPIRQPILRMYSAQPPSSESSTSFVSKWANKILPKPRVFDSPMKLIDPQNISKVDLITEKRSGDWHKQAEKLGLQPEAAHSALQLRVNGEPYTYEATQPGERALLSKGRNSNNPTISGDVSETAQKRSVLNVQAQLSKHAFPDTASGQAEIFHPLLKYLPEGDYPGPMIDPEQDKAMANPDLVGKVPLGNIGEPYSWVSGAGSVLQEAGLQKGNPLLRGLQFTAGTALRFITHGDSCSDLASKAVGQYSMTKPQLPDNVEESYAKRGNKD